MSHPSREEWMDYLYGELDAARQDGMTGHLDGCEDCRKALSSWRAVMEALDSWKVRQPLWRAAPTRRALRWAAAAALLLALGYALGRLSAPPRVDIAALANRLEPALRKTLSQDMESRCQAAMAAAQDELRQEMLVQVRAEMKDQAAATLEAATSATSSLLAEYAQSLESARRTDLLALANATEQELWRTRWQLANALTYSQPATPASPNTGALHANQ